MSQPQPQRSENQDRLRTHFNSHPPSTHPSRWDSLWASGDFLPWDRGHSNPALIDTLSHPPSSVTLPKPLRDDGKRRTVLVPGCGKGYDVALFAAHGYNAYGLEVSPNAVNAATTYLEEEAGEGPLEGEYKVRDESVGRGNRSCVEGDFFEDGWFQEVGGSAGSWDIIYDNTFLCALAPSMRPKWAKRMAQLLAPNGILICLEFPTHKPASSGGPPFSLPSLVHEELFRYPGAEIMYDSGGKVVATGRAVSDKALVKVAHWKPERTYKVGIVNGEVTDRVSVWKHK